MLIVLLTIVLSQYSTSSPIDFNVRRHLLQRSLSTHMPRPRFDINMCLDIIHLYLGCNISQYPFSRHSRDTVTLETNSAVLCLFPELILVWAYRQWSGARYYENLFKGELNDDS